MPSDRTTAVENHVDVLVLGLGSGALEAARTLAAAGVRFAVVAPSPLGARLAAEPELPLATLLHAAHLGFDMRHAHPFGFLHSEEVKVDPIMVMRRVREVREKALAARLREHEPLLARLKEGEAVFESPDRVKVGADTFTFGALLVDDEAPRTLPPPWEPVREHVRSLEEVFDLPALPKHAVIAGAGPRALELAQAMARLGSAVTCLVPRGEPFAGLGKGPVAEAARKALAKELTFVDVDLERLEARAVEGAKVRMAGEGFEATATCLVLATEDRAAPAPRERPLPEGKGTHVFRLRDHAPEVAPESSYLSKERGRLAARAALASLGKETEPASRELAVTFVLARTSPAVARVGLDEAAAIGSGARVHAAASTEAGLTLSCGKEAGLVRLFSSPDSGRLLGAEICHEKGEHLAHAVALALRAGLTVDALAQPPWEPAWESDLGRVARA